MQPTESTPAREAQPDAAPNPPQYTKADVPTLRQRVIELKRTLGGLHQQKEQAFAKRKQIDSQLSAIAQALKQAKDKRDALTKEVKERKQVRSQVSKDIQSRVGEIKKLSEERQQLLAKHKVQGNPEALRAELNALEYKIETQGLSFTKEQELMKVINGKKKQLAQFKQLGAVFERVRQIDTDLRQMRMQAEGAHRDVQEKASASQHEHEVLVKDSKQLRQLRVERKKLNDDCTRLKEEFGRGDNELKTLLDALHKLGAEVAEERKQQHQDDQRKQKLSLAERGRQVEEKLRKGGKLTTEDLLVLQGMP